MLFSGEILIPKGTPLDDPEETQIKLIKGLITQIDIFFPPGNRCKAFITFNRAIHQIYPTNEGAHIKGDRILVVGKVFHHIKAEPTVITVKGFSPDANYVHRVYFNIWMKHLWQLNPYSDEWWTLLQEDSIRPGVIAEEE